jgi:DNA-binding transcriptional MerR regulator
MSDSASDEDLARLAADLARSLRDLQRELEPGERRRLRPPSPKELLRFTDEVAIPAAILVLETNVRALRLLQRAIRLADPDRDRTGGRDTAVRDRAVQLSQTTVRKLDDVLADVQDAVEGRPTDDEAERVLAEARSLRDEIDDRLAAETEATEGEADTTTAATVPVDVDAELQSIKDDLDGDDSDGNDDGARR